MPVVTKEHLYEQKIKKAIERISSQIYRERVQFSAEVFKSIKSIPLKESIGLKREKIGVGEKWGDAWESAYFLINAVVPNEFENKPLAALINFGGESLVYSKEGVPLCGLTDTNVFQIPFKKEVYFLPSKHKGGDKIELFVESAANDLFGIARKSPANRKDPKRHGVYETTLEMMDLCVVDEATLGLFYDMKFLYQLLLSLDPQGVKRAKLIHSLNEAVNLYKENPENAELVRKYLQPELAKKASASALSTAAVGHAHIDTAWMWSVNESIRKCARTFSSQINLCERYSDYIFGVSQPQLLAFTKEHYPELFEKIKAHVAKGQWECQGGMWVEADCNLTSGESLVRQVLHGKNFWKDEFGKDVKNLWLPDVFGYSAALPQILQKAGIDTFLTQKISWSQFTQFPHHTFYWKGIDGTKILTHFPPEDTYNSTLDPVMLTYSDKNFKEKGFLDKYMTLFGIGNGGGGPKEEHIEFGIREKNIEGQPKVVFQKCSDFFDELKAQNPTLSTWDGELYLELHRGTLTTQARTKRLNRKSEFVLKQLEGLCSSLPLSSYPKAELDKMWKLVLINQFHDILPGSSIHDVYITTEAELTGIINSSNLLLNQFAGKLFSTRQGSAVLYNSLSYEGTVVVALPMGWTGAKVGQSNLQVQKMDETLYALVPVLPHSYTNIENVAASAANAGSVSVSNKKFSGGMIENDLIRYEFNEHGNLISAFDKTLGKEFLADGGLGNVLSLYIDEPHNWDAWDVDFYYKEMLLGKAEVTGASEIFDGAVVCGFDVSYKLGQSTFEQKIRLAKGSKRLDFITSAKWNEYHKMARVSFETAINAREASFDVQYGVVKRAAHKNTLADFAMFETAGHKFADLSDAECGVALLNDCKYGYSVFENVLDLNILRAPTEPDPDADLGDHQFTYSFLPHDKQLFDSNVQKESSFLNVPPILFENLESKVKKQAVSVDSEGISLEVIKKAEKEDHLVVRLVETKGRNSEGVLSINPEVFPTGKANLVLTGIMEWDNLGSETINDKISIVLKPFEIRTYLVKKG